MQSTSTLNTDSATKSSAFEQYKASLESKSPRQSGYLLFLAMMYLTVMLCSGVLTHRLIQLGPVYTMAGTLVAPLWFTLSDVIAEIYGYKVARKLVWFGFVCQAIFAIVCNLLIQIPSPDFLDNQAAYFTVLGSILHTCLSAFVAYIFAGFINIYLISKWKILLMGRYFWLRSLGASTISEFIFTVLAVFLIQVGKLPLSQMLTIMAVSYSLKVVYTIVLAFPANILTFAIKKADGIDVYDHHTNFNPFKLTN
jgi:queuosine precursor transporter